MDIKNTKELVDFAIGLGNAAGLAASDGKIDISDIALFITPLKDAGPALADMNQIIPELTDLSVEERQELLAHVEQKFNIPQEKIEEVVEAGLGVLAQVHRVIVALKKPAA